MEEVIQTIWILIKNLHLWLLLSALVCVMSVREGIVSVGVGFGGIFFLILFLGWDKILGEYIMTRSLIAIGLGLIIGFFCWIMID